MSIIEHIDSVKQKENSRIVLRLRLLNLLKRNKRKNVILVQSPAGYGKTTLVTEFLRENNIDSALITASEVMNHLYTFIYNLVNALKLINPAFGNNTLQILESRRLKHKLSEDEKSVAEELCQTLVNDFNQQFDEDAYVVLDDFHKIEDSVWLKSFFKVLFNDIPGNLHIFIITRQVPDISFMIPAIKDQLLRLETDDLVFTPEETTLLLKNVYSIDHSAVDTGILCEKIGGWITGIHMLLQTYGKEFDKLEIHPQKIPENIFNFLAEEIFAGLDSDSREFLLATAPLKNFSEDICDYLNGICDAKASFRKLLGKNLILENPSLNGRRLAKKNYYYNILFRKYLSEKLCSTFPSEKICRINSAILKYYECRKDITSLLNHLFINRDFEAGIPLMIENFDSLFKDGKFEYLWSWMAMIDRSIIENNPYLIFYNAVLYKFFIGDLKLALEYLQRAISLLKTQNDSDFLIRCLITKAGVLLNLGRTCEVIDELTDLLNEDTSPQNRSRLLFYLGRAYYQLSRYEISVNFLNKALGICTEHKISSTENHIYILLGHINLIKGEYKKSIAYYEARPEGNSNILDRFETLCNLTLLNSQSGNYWKSRKYLERLDEMISSFPSAIFRIPYLLAKQAYLFESGAYDENVKVLSEIAKTAVSMNHRNHLYLSYRLLSDTYYHMGDLERAQIFYENAFSALDDLDENELEKIELAVVKSLIRKKYEPDGTVESILLLAYDYYEKQELHYSKTQICYHLADYYFSEDRVKEAMIYFKRCLEESKQRDYISHLLREMAHSERLFQFALSNKIEEEFINKLIIRKSEIFSKMNCL